jgi:hypothetical protein
MLGEEEWKRKGGALLLWIERRKQTLAVAAARVMGRCSKLMWEKCDAPGAWESREKGRGKPEHGVVWK